MSRTATFFLLVVAPALAILLALLGVETVRANPLGWFLLLLGIAYASGVVIAYYIHRERFWESRVCGATTEEEISDRSFWLITFALMTVFYLSPLEYLYSDAILPRNTWMSSVGVLLVVLSSGLFIWARRALRKNYSGHISVKTGQALVQDGPYRIVRHPAYAGYLCMALGISLGYSSLAGLISVLVLLLPSLVYRIKVEEKLLTEHFGDTYRQYMRKTKRLIPGIW